MIIIQNDSQTCIKRPCIRRSPALKRSVVKVPKITCLNYCNFDLYIKRSPLLSGRGHPLQGPDELFLYLASYLILTCIKRSLCKRKPFKYYSSSYSFSQIINSPNITDFALRSKVLSALWTELFFH